MAKSRKTQNQKKPPNLPDKSEPKEDDQNRGEADKPLTDLLERLPEGTPPDVIQTLTEASYSGPLPPPSMYAQYEEVLEGSADRIMSMAENEQEIRKRDNGRILLNDTLRVSGAITVSIAMILAAVFVTYLGFPFLGGVLGTAGVVSGVVREFLKK